MFIAIHRFGPLGPFPTDAPISPTPAPPKGWPCVGCGVGVFFAERGVVLSVRERHHGAPDEVLHRAVFHYDCAADRLFGKDFIDALPPALTREYLRTKGGANTRPVEH